MKGHVSKRGKTWAYWFDITPDPLTGKRRQQTRSGFKSEREAWKECRTAIADYERGHVVTASHRKVAAALDEWLTRIEHSIKPSMVQNWRNYAAYYVIPYIGQRDVQDIDGAVCDALYAKLLAEGRVKARPKKRPTTQAVHMTAAGTGWSGPAVSSTRIRHGALLPLALGRRSSSRPANRGEKAERDGGREGPRGFTKEAAARPGAQDGREHAPHAPLGRGKTSRSGDGRSGTSWPTRIPHGCRVRAARSGRSLSFRRFCNVHGRTAFLRCGCSKPLQACGAASWRAYGVTCSTWPPARLRSMSRGWSWTAR